MEKTSCADETVYQMTSQSKENPKQKNPAPPEIWIPANPGHNGRGPSTVNWLLAGFFALTLTLIFGLAVILAALFFYSDIIMPGAYVMGVNVGSMTRAEAASTLQNRWQQQQITLEHNAGSWTMGAADLGMSFDA